ncbi:MAG: extracellular solute-binding protein [Chloroflexi bacterium]|nr:extracellular solute-binding protein [Chloroflexota bacterium]
MKRLLLSLAVGAAVLAMACAPKGAPAPQAPAPATLAPVATPTSNLSPVRQAQGELPTSQDAAWAKVVETAKKEGQINVYTWGWTGDTGVSIARAFENRYGVKVNLITGRGAEFIERIKTETRMGSVTADMFEGASAHSENMRLAGLLTQAGDLPVLRDKSVFSADPFMFSPEGYYLVENQFYLALYINTNLVKPGEEPKAWADLLEPKWKGKIIWADPVVSVSSSYFAVMIAEKRMGLDFLEKLGKQDLMFDPSTPGVASKIARGEAWVGYTDTNAVSPIALEGGPIRIIDTKEGVFANGLALGPVKNGPHPNATRLLINWMLGPEGQDIYTKAKGVLTVRKDVPDHQPKAVQLKPQNPVFIGSKYNDLVAKTFADKTFVPLLKPK